MQTLLILTCVTATLVPTQAKKGEKKETPRLLMASPMGVTPGKTTNLTFRGLRLDQATEIKVSPQGTAKLTRKAKSPPPPQQEAALSGDSEVEIELELSEDVAGDKLQVIVVTPDGESSPLDVLIDRAEIVQEKEPNNGFKQAQELKIGQTCEGVIGRPQDVDVYRFEAEAGQKIVLEVTAARLGSALDSFLTLYDGEGQIVTINDDHKDSRDSRIEARIKRSGTYFVSVVDAHDQGGVAHRYRLRIVEQKP